MIGPIRSLMFVPGIRQDRFEKAMNAGADAVVFDLEDAVEASQKAKARELVAAFLSRPRVSDAARLVRFNAVNTAAGEDDLDVFAPHPSFDGVLLPKVETVGVVELVFGAEDFTAQLGVPRTIAIHPRQVPVINEVFTPGAAEIDRAGG